MKVVLRGLIIAAAAIAGSSAFHVASARAQAGGQQGPVQEPPVAEDVFTNVQLLRGIPVDEFMDTMGFFSAATGLNCQDCHVGESAGDWAKYADETGRKATARRMMAMVTALNRANFGGRSVVSCWSCHRGTNVPEFVPDLAVQYSNALPRDPFEISASDAYAPSIDTVKDMLTEWRVGATTAIDDRGVQLVQGKLRPGGLPVTWYFDAESGLLVRVLLYTSSPVGINPRQIDFADYRDVAGIKMPFRWTVTWTDGQSTTEVAEIQPNVTIDASRFAQPPVSEAVTRGNQ